jgi:hypothetical protein
MPSQYPTRILQWDREPEDAKETQHMFLEKISYIAASKYMSISIRISLLMERLFICCPLIRWKITKN